MCCRFMIKCNKALKQIYFIFIVNFILSVFEGKPFKSTNNMRKLQQLNLLLSITSVVLLGAPLHGKKA